MNFTFTRISMKAIYQLNYQFGLYSKEYLASLVHTEPWSNFLPSEYEEITGEKWVDPDAAK